MKKDFCELPWIKRTLIKECILISLIWRIFQAQSSLQMETIQIIRHFQPLVVLKSSAATLKTRNESKYCSLRKTKDQLSKWIKFAGCPMVKWLTALWGTCWLRTFPSHLQRCFNSKTLQSNLPTVSDNNFFNFYCSSCAKSCWPKWINYKMAAQQSSEHKPNQGHEGYTEQDRGWWSFYDDQKNAQCCQDLESTPESEPKTGIFLKKGIIRCINRSTAAKLSIKTALNC